MASVSGTVVCRTVEVTGAVETERVVPGVFCVVISVWLVCEAVLSMGDSPQDTSKSDKQNKMRKRNKSFFFIYFQKP